MEHAGTASWRVDVADSQLCEIGLFVRDAAGLRSEADDVPPLDGPVPHAVLLPTEDERATARRDWSRWWRTLVRYEVRSWSTGVDDGRARLRRQMAKRDAACDPPDFDALANRQDLRGAAQTRS